MLLRTNTVCLVLLGAFLFPLLATGQTAKAVEKSAVPTPIIQKNYDGFLKDTDIWYSLTSGGTTYYVAKNLNDPGSSYAECRYACYTPDASLRWTCDQYPKGYLPSNLKKQVPAGKTITKAFYTNLLSPSKRFFTVRIIENREAKWKHYPYSGGSVSTDAFVKEMEAFMMLHR